MGGCSWPRPTGILTWPRVAAAVIAIVLTLVMGIATRSSHPPAAATTLLVALGSRYELDEEPCAAAGEERRHRAPEIARLAEAAVVVSEAGDEGRALRRP